MDGAQDWGLGQETAQLNEETDASLTEEEDLQDHLEPPRPQVRVRATPDPGTDVPESSKVFRLRGGYEEALKDDPFVVTFPGMAGHSYSVNELKGANKTTTDEYLKYGTAFEADNPFAPFSSRMDWEIGRWAKLRGPGSTAFSELMSIEGVSGS